MSYVKSCCLSMTKVTISEIIFVLFNVLFIIKPLTNLKQNIKFLKCNFCIYIYIYIYIYIFIYIYISCIPYCHPDTMFSGIRMTQT